MAQQFLDQLPRIRRGELPRRSACSICHSEYGTDASENGIVEVAVRLPCKHHVGSQCIISWLSPTGAAGNSCPLCRVVFFPVQPRPYMEHEMMGDNEEDEEGGIATSTVQDNRAYTHPALFAAFQRLRSSVGRDRHGGLEGRPGQPWYERWPLPTTRKYEESLINARRTLLMIPPNCPADWAEQAARSYGSPMAFESVVAGLAEALRTVDFRETLLYLNLRETGARFPPLEAPYKGLNSGHEEALFRELRLRGAFGPEHALPHRTGLSNRELWNAHREQGEVYTHLILPANDEGYWSMEF